MIQKRGLTNYALEADAFFKGIPFLANARVLICGEIVLGEALMNKPKRHIQSPFYKDKL